MNYPDFIHAYENEQFLKSKEARALRILSEFLEPSARFKKHQILDTIVFFGSARTMNKKDALKNLRQVESKLRGNSTPGAKLKAELKTAKGLLELAPYYEACHDLAFSITKWSKNLDAHKNRFVIVSGGGGGMMEAANHGAKKAGGKSIGLNITLPFEQDPNPHITKGLGFSFHYFFMRKFWFVYLAKAALIFPGGFGTFDELMELLTLIQTKKLSKKRVPLVLFGSKFWNSVFNFDALVDWGVISPGDLNLFKITDSIEEAHDYVTSQLKELYL